MTRTPAPHLPTPLALLLAVLVALGPAAPPVAAQVSMGTPRPRSDDVAELRRRFEASPHDTRLLLDYAMGLIARDRVEDRNRAQDLLKKAVGREPGNVDLRLALADLYQRQGYFTLAQRQLTAVLRHNQDAAPAYVLLGRMAMRDWVKFQRRGSLDSARLYWQEAARRKPGEPGPWLGLGLIALLENDHAGAVAAGRQARAATRRTSALERGEAWLLEGAGAYGLGWAETADSAFLAALPLLAGPVRDRLLDITPAAADQDTMLYGSLLDSGARERFLDRFWKARDPDLTTRLNEVQLEMLARGTLAYFLFYDAKARTWDERGNFLVRYGPPDSTDYNPAWIDGGPFPVGSNLHNRVVWHYPGLGMNMVFEEKFLNGRYDIPWSMTDVIDFVPDWDSLDVRVQDGELTAAGRGVFRQVLPGKRRLRGHAELALFRRVRGFDPRVSLASTGLGLGGRGPAGRVEAYLAVEGGSEANLLGMQAVVFEDSTFREVARATTTDYAWCLSDTLQVAQFNFDLPPGHYVVGLSVRDSLRDGTGAWRLKVYVPPALPGRVELSDLELACSREEGLRAESFRKIDDTVIPNPKRWVARDQPFGLYFEVYNLVSDENGRSKVRLEYSIRSTRKDSRPFFIKAVNPRRVEPAVNLERSDEIPGRARFQYVSADLTQQPPGPYRIEVTAIDETTGLTATKVLDFELVD